MRTGRWETCTNPAQMGQLIIWSMGMGRPKIYDSSPVGANRLLNLFFVYNLIFKVLVNSKY